MLIAWFPSQIFRFYLFYLQNTEGLPSGNFVVTTAYLIGCNALNGLLLALIFYIKTQNARRAWLNNFRSIFFYVVKEDIDIDERSSCSSIVSIEDSSIKQWNQGTNRLSEPFNIQHQGNPMNDNNVIVRISESL